MNRVTQRVVGASATHSRTSSPAPTTSNVSTSSTTTARTSARKGQVPSRRTVLFKQRRPNKSTSVLASTKTVRVAYDGDRCLRVGDIVSVCDVDDAKLYFAQINALIVDAYALKSAELHWLLPTDNAPDRHRFSGKFFYRGPADDSLYPIETLQYVCRPTPDNIDTSHLCMKWTPVSAIKRQKRATFS